MKRFNFGRDVPARYAIPALSVVALFGLIFFVAPTRDNRPLALFLSNPFNKFYIVISLVALLIFGARGADKKRMWWALDVVIFNLLMAQGLKLVAHLPRPSGGLSGFPSGHTMFAFALAWLLLETRSRLMPLWFMGAVAIGWARVAAGAHYPYQVVAGAFFGIFIGWTVSHAAQGVLFPRCFRLFRPRT